ncbi:CPCC family cysteine-rich protein [Actinomadura sp. GTD37]|uniref:CPCC family cysteine-rich protein n=1 Tax=Actinomadura sp. GTD37 TaxID=1778030 RepID=UPI0035C14864
MSREVEGASDEELARRAQWFEGYVNTVSNHSIHRPEDSGPYACPCCGYLTLASRGDYEICGVCFWEDDGQDEHDAGVVRGGPNGRLSLTRARQNFARFGACKESMLGNVREPLPHEHPLADQP